MKEVDSELIVLDRQRNQPHQLNATANVVWKSLAAGDSNEAIADKLVSTFAAPESNVLKEYI